MTKLNQFILLFLIIVSVNSCKLNDSPKKDILTQYSTIDAILKGVYDGFITLDDISQKGDFGIGTFDALNGEMIFFRDTFYQVKSDGKIYIANKLTRSPFASVTFFDMDKELLLKNSDYSTLKNKISQFIPSLNHFYAIKVEGYFEYVKTRSVPEQSKPYKPLVEIAATQAEFETENIFGTLIGFYSPEFVKGVNVPGYHLHFLSDDREFGGHLLEFKLKEGKATIDQISSFTVVLPEKGDFLTTSLGEDLSDDLKKSE